MKRIEVEGVPRKAVQALRHVRSAMIRRCYNPACQTYRYYGARGIGVCDEWLHSVVEFIQWAVRSGFQLGLEIDRINADLGYFPNNCRWANKPQQRWNRGKLAAHRAASKYKGVGFCKSSKMNPWRACIRCNGHRMHIGLFSTEEAAARAYDAAAIHHFGEFARLNFPLECVGA